MTALEGMRVLDLSQYEAGTSCTMLLAWLGADVVKIEPPGSGDPGRAFGVDIERSGYFLNWNANKRSVAIDLRNDEGRDLLLKMLPGFDVFVENFGPGVVEKLGLEYDVLSEIHPALIYASLKGFGSDGPYAGYKSFDMVAQAAAGAFSVTGMSDGPPLRPGTTTGDSGSGLHLALAITAAWVQKIREGVGQKVEVSMQEATTFFMRTNIGTGSDWGTRAASRAGSGLGPFMNLFPCKPFGSNDYVYLLALTPRMRDALRRVIGIEGDQDFGTEEVEAWTCKHDKFEAMRVLAEAGVPASSVNDTMDLFNDPHLRARGFVREVDHPVLGKVPLLGPPARLSASDVSLEPAPLLGQHTEEILLEELSMSKSEMDSLFANGTLGGQGST